MQKIDLGTLILDKKDPNWQIKLEKLLVSLKKDDLMYKPFQKKA